MAKGTPDPLKRRHLVEDDLPPARALDVAESYLAADRPVDALIFLEKAEARDRIEALQEQAAADGDVFLMRATAAALREDVPAERWELAAAAAEASGKLLYAKEARRQAERA